MRIFGDRFERRRQHEATITGEGKGLSPAEITRLFPNYVSGMSVPKGYALLEPAHRGDPLPVRAPRHDHRAGLRLKSPNHLSHWRSRFHRFAGRLGCGKQGCIFLSLFSLQRRETRREHTGQQEHHNRSEIHSSVALVAAVPFNNSPYLRGIRGGESLLQEPLTIP